MGQESFIWVVIHGRPGLGGPRGLCRALRGWREILGRIQWGPEQESLPESQEIGLCVHSAVKISTYK